LRGAAHAERSQAAAITKAASGGINPSRACTEARAASKLSIAASQLVSETAAAMAGVVRLGPKRRSAGIA